MSQNLAAPIAITLNPSEFPYRFIEFLAFRGDFDRTVRPGEPVNPKGIAYHRGLNRLLVSLSPTYVPHETRFQFITTIASDGSRTRFAPSYQAFRAVESKITIVPESGPPVSAGFTPGDVFVGRGPLTEISRLSSSGEVIADVFAEFGLGGGFWGGLCFDTEGDFGGRLIAAEANGKIYLINPDGTSVLFTDLVLRLEGLAIAPPTFGPHAKNMIIGVEGYGDEDLHGGEIYAVNKEKVKTLLANIGYAAEDIQFIPPMSGRYYQTQLAFDRERENRLLTVSSSQFLNRLGRMIVVNEMTGELWEVAWDGTRYTQQNVGKVPGRWSTSGFNVQGTELEAGCFAVHTPRLPSWTDWQGIPGGFTTDRAPGAATDVFGDVIVFSKQLSDRLIYMNGYNKVPPQSPDTTIPPDPGIESEWTGWRRDPQSIVTPHAVACTMHNYRMYAFAVRTDGSISHKYFTEIENEQTIQPWTVVPGGMLTNTNVSCATVNGRIVLCALGQDRQIYINELAPGGRYWSGWSVIPGGGNTDAAPAVVSFQDELHVFIKGLTSKRILLKTRTPDGDWAPWAEVPGSGKTDTAVAAIATEDQMYVFVKADGGREPYLNVASHTGTWSGWQMLPNPGATDTSMASASTGNRVFLLAKGIDDRQLYVRSTL